MDTHATILQKRMKSLLSSTAELSPGALNDPRDDSLDTRLDELVALAEKCVNAKETLGPKDGDMELDRVGTNLWNTVVTLSRALPDYSNERMHARFLRARLLAFLVLKCSQSFERTGQENVIRLFKLAIKLGRICLDQKETILTAKVMEQAAQYQGELSKFTPQDGTSQDPKVPLLVSEYFVLRALLAWRQSSISLMEFMYSKAMEHAQVCLDPRQLERIAEVWMDIGNELLNENSTASAAKWLERAFDTVNRVEPEFLSESGTELRLSVTHSFVKVLVKIALPETLQKAKTILDTMVEDWPTRLAVHLLKLDYVLAKSPDNTDGYRDAILGIIATVQLTEATLKVLLRRIHVLSSKKAHESACVCLDNLIGTRILPMEKEEWLESCFVTRLWLTVQDHSDRDDAGVGDLRALLDTIQRRMTEPLGHKATHAAQILLWKNSEVFFLQKNYSLAASWARLALHSVFDRSGELNHAKISRRVIQCGILTANFGMAAETYNDMPESCRNAPLSRFLMFQVALRMSDSDAAIGHLRSLCETKPIDRRLLYACAIEAQECGNRRLALEVFHAILFEAKPVPTEGHDVPTILRCIIRIAMYEIENGTKEVPNLIEYLCSLYEKAAEHATRSKQRARTHGTIETILDVNELDWFTRNGYNLGLRAIIEWPPNQARRVLAATICFMELYPDDVGTAAYAEVTQRRLLCEYLAASLCIELARAADDITDQSQQYLTARNHIAEFRSRNPEGESDKEMAEKFKILLGYDFEAATRLKAWGVLSQLVDEAFLLEGDNNSLLGTMSDVILASRAPEATVLTVLQRLVGGMAVTSGAVVKLAALMRCLVQMAMVKDTKVAEQLLEQAVEIAKNAGPGVRYPEEEIHWLAASTWNKAIDFSCASDNVNGKRFASLALSFARLLSDESLFRDLQKRTLNSNMMS